MPTAGRRWSAHASWFGCQRHDDAGRERARLRRAGGRPRRADPRAVLVGDDRVHLDTVAGQLWVRPAQELAGLIEIRGLGIRRCDFAIEAIVGLVVDLSAGDAERLPPPDALTIRLNGVLLPRIPVGMGYDPLPLIAAALTTTASSGSVQPLDDCSKGIGNHISPNIATD